MDAGSKDSFCCIILCSKDSYVENITFKKYK